jgi:ATP-dependent Lon protease
MQLQPYWRVRYETLEEPGNTAVSALELEALVQHTREQLEHLLSMSKLIPPDMLILADHARVPGRLADVILANLGLGVEEAQTLLELPDPVRRPRALANCCTKN